MKKETKNICNTLLSQTVKIADAVEKASFTGLGIQEETITDLILNNIQYEHEENFYTRKFTRREEGNYSGADWLWCIGEPGAWITFAVQAKITNIKTGRVNYLHYRSGKQHSLLINFSKQFGFIPKYAVYANPDKTVDLFSRKMLKNVPFSQWAFTSISPRYIKHLSTPKERHMSTVLQYAIPWTYAFCEEKNTNTLLANSIAQKLDDIYWLFENEYRRQHNQKEKFKYQRTNWENPEPLKLLSKSIPLPVLYLLTQDNFPSKVPVPNVSVLSRRPALQVLDLELEKNKNLRQWKNFPKVFEQKVRRLKENEASPFLLQDKW